MLESIKNIFVKPQIFIISPIALVDGRFIGLLTNLPLKGEIVIQENLDQIFKNWSKSSENVKKEGKRGLINIKKINDLKNFKIKKNSKLQKFSDVLKKYQKKDYVNIIAVHNESDHLAQLYSINIIKLNKIAHLLYRKYWVGKKITVKPKEIEDEMLKGRLSDGTDCFIDASSDKIGIKYSCRISSIVDHSQGITLYLKKDNSPKRKRLWDLVQ